MTKAVVLLIGLIAAFLVALAWNALSHWGIALLPAGWGRVLLVVGWIFVGGPIVLFIIMASVVVSSR